MTRYFKTALYASSVPASDDTIYNCLDSYIYSIILIYFLKDNQPVISFKPKCKRCLSWLKSNCSRVSQK